MLFVFSSIFSLSYHSWFPPCVNSKKFKNAKIKISPQNFAAKLSFTHSLHTWWIVNSKNAQNCPNWKLAQNFTTRMNNSKKLLEQNLKISLSKFKKWRLFKSQSKYNKIKRWVVLGCVEFRVDESLGPVATTSRITFNGARLIKQPCRCLFFLELATNTLVLAPATRL